MGIQVRYDLRVVLLLVFFTFTSAYYDNNWRVKDGDDRSIVSAYNELAVTNILIDAGCCKQSCMIGRFCNESVASYSPQFSNGFTFVEITKAHVGEKVGYNATTYPTPNGCRCGHVVYSLLSVRNDMEPDEESGTVFVINKTTGEISLQQDLDANEMYSLVVEARNTQTGTSSQTRLTVARKVQPTDVMDEYSPIKNNGFDIGDGLHYRQKRGLITGDQINFDLTKLTNINETKVGNKISFRLEIVFPANSNLDMLVELFAPDNDTTVMILCDVSVHISGLSTDPYTIQEYSKDSNTITRPDRVVIDFGMVYNNHPSNADKMTILYSAIMIANTQTVNGNTYWISAGAGFGDYLWVGQASVLANYDVSTTFQPVFFVDAPTTVEVGSTHAIDVHMQLPYPHVTYIFKVYTPSDAPGTMSVCSMYYDALTFGSNFGCGNDFNTITTALTPDPVGVGNSIGEVNYGMLLNDGSRDVNPLVDASNISLSFITKVYSNVLVGSAVSLALSLEVDSTTLWVGNLSMIVTIKTSASVSPSISSVTTDLPAGNQATVGDSFTITYKLQVPAPSATGAGSTYAVEVLAPFTTEAIFSVCNLEIVSFGQDLPCLIKDDIQPTYLSRAATGGTVPDTGRLDIGAVTNVQRSLGLNDDIIEIKATFSPIEGKALLQNYDVYFGVTVDSASVVMHNETIDVAFASNAIAVTNETAPSIDLDYWDAQSNVRVHGVTRVDIDILTAPNITYPVMELEFLMPTDTTNTYLHVCKVKVQSRGKNLPCLTPEWSNKIVQYISKFDNEEHDRAKLDLQRLCNTGEYADNNENRAIISLYLKVMNLDSLADNTNHWISGGLMYSDTKLWIGQIQATVRTDIGLPISAPTGTIHHFFQRNSTAGSISVGESARYSLLLKIPPNEYLDLKVLVTSSAQGLDICAVRIFAAGDNLPCIEDDLTTKTYTYHADDGRLSNKMDIGVFKKFDNDAININNFFDADSVIIEVIVTGTAAGSYTFNLEAFVDTAENSVNAIQYLTEAVTVTTPSFIQPYVDLINMTLTVGEFIKNETVDTNIAIGEVKLLLLNATIPENSMYKMEYSVIIPSAYIGKLDIQDAAIFSVGANLPCIDVEKISPQLTGTPYTDTALFDIGYSCNSPVKPGEEEENSVVFEVYVRAMPNGMVTIGDSLEVTGSLKVNDGATISVTGLTLTAVGTDTFVDKVESLEGISNSTLLQLDQPSNVLMTIGQNLTINVTVTVPPKSQSRFYFDLQMPVDNSEACLIIWDMRVLGSIGRNVLFMGPSVSKGLSFEPVYNSTLNTGQQDYGLLDLGIITNTGLSYRLKTNTTNDDDFSLEVDIQMADCGDSAHGKTHLLSFGNNLATAILIYEHAVQVNRDGNELPDIKLDVIHNVKNYDTLVIDAIVYHSNISTAEGKNTSVFVYLPAYQMAPATLVSNNIPSRCSVNSVEPDVLEVMCTSFYFNDTLTFSASVAVNTTVELSPGFSASDSAAWFEIGTDFIIHSSNYVSEDWYPYYVNGTGINSMEYSVAAGIGTGCVAALGMQDGTIQSCQITGSTGSITDPSLARLHNTAGQWRPFIRGGDVARQRYIQVYFGNVVKVTQVAVQQSSTVKVTKLLVEHSNDGIAWFGEEQIDLGLSPSSLETVTVAGAQEAKYIRLYLWDTTTPSEPDVSLRFELYGCQISGTMTPTQICDSAPSTTVSSDYYDRSFLVTSSSKVFVCDRKLNNDYSQCHTSTDGDLWTMEEDLATVVGESGENHIFGYARDRETILMSEDDGNSWQAVNTVDLTDAKAAANWKGAINVIETLDNSLNQPSPTASFTQDSWAANYQGMYLTGQQRLMWTST